ncbi:hypothetical protein T01_1124 [Trichinella spiralis]|uniref:Uncharacterized protein n=1 Tax=Trichinella spiralis TaxID=6334 RepID=A0A0V1B8H7_TRISP|nr:hypothetical protein T01_1124 [Trichinella spiralis]
MCEYFSKNRFKLKLNLCLCTSTASKQAQGMHHSVRYVWLFGLWWPVDGDAHFDWLLYLLTGQVGLNESSRHKLLACLLACLLCSLFIFRSVAPKRPVVRFGTMEQTSVCSRN